jgi:NAD(P)-dependent dehydrogenase (short-subunit alcohol dehydrogenase family)
MNYLNEFSLKNKVIIVTGGSGLLGSEFCRAIAKHQGIPVILCRDISKSIKLVKEIYNNFQIKCFAIKCDVTKEARVKKVYQILKKKYQKECIFGLINNAAYNPKPKPNKNKNKKTNNLENFNTKIFDRELNIGLKGSFICSKIFGSHFAKQRKGSIINISSDLGIISPNQNLYSHLNYLKPISYSINKHGIIGLTKYLSTYWGGQGVRCNTVAPGGVFDNHDKKFVTKIKKEIPLKRMGKAKDFNGIIIYLMSDLSTYTTGALISIDGGRTII